MKNTPQLNKMGHLVIKTRTITVLAAALTLTACAQLQSVPAGTPVSQVEKQFGKPTTVCTNNDGTQRMIWTLQPLGQYAYGSFISKEGNIVAMKQLLTDEHFAVLGKGKWTAQQVTCEFGPPANTDSVGKGNEIVWAYRYKQSDVWASMMYVYMGADGKEVTHFHPGPDPWTLGGGDGRR